MQDNRITKYETCRLVSINSSCSSTISRLSRFMLTSLLVAGQCFCSASSAPSSSGLTSSSQVTSTQRKPTRTSTQSYRVPEWWRREWTRRQYVKQFENIRRAQEARESTKAMWNPRSPQAMAYRRAYLNSHRELFAQQNSASKTRTDSRPKSKADTGF